MSEPIIELVGVSKRFVKRVDPVARLLNRFGADYRESVLHAVEEVDLTVKPGEVLGLVGESGCGKSTLGRVVAGLLQPSAGEVRYHGRNVGELSEEQTRKYRMDIQIIFQDPYASLNPRRRVREIISEAPRIHGIWKNTEIDERLGEVMERVGLDPKVRDRYPHQFSGGQRQRIGIARAIAVDPGFIVCDEAVAALDVSIQAQILNLFMRLREEMGLTYLFISHDLGVIRHLSDRVAVMYLGRIVESNSAANLIAQPNHPYTQALLNEVPRIDDRQRDFPPVYGEIPSPLDPPSGCAYHPRCPHAFDRCRVESPELVTIAPGHRSACHLNERG